MPGASDFKAASLYEKLGTEICLQSLQRRKLGKKSTFMKHDVRRCFEISCKHMVFDTVFLATWTG